MRPDISRVPQFYHNYISHVPQDDLMEAFSIQSKDLFKFLDSVPSDKYDYRYAADKWTIKEVLQHVIDAERIFNFRALCFARGDKTPLPGFEEKTYVENSKAAERNWSGLVEEFKTVRKSSEYLFGSFDKNQLDATGIANDNSNYVLGMGFILIGHSLHHQQIIAERYL